VVVRRALAYCFAGGSWFDSHVILFLFIFIFLFSVFLIKILLYLNQISYFSVAETNIKHCVDG